MRHYYNVKVLNTFFVFLVYLMLGVSSCANAQGSAHRIIERGAEVSYGFHHFERKKSENRVSDFSPASRGISIGYAIGNSLVKGRIRGLGFYESTSSADAQFLMY